MTFFYCTTDQVRVSSICVNFLWELCPFWNLEYWKYTVFRTFLLHAFTYWAEILHMPFFLLYYRSSTSVVNFYGSYAPFGTSNTGNTQFSALFSYMLWHIELKFCIWLCFTVLQIKFECRQFASIFVGVMPLLELRILEIHSFPHFSLTCFYILSWNFAYAFFFTVLQIKYECRQFLWELCPFWNFEYWKYTVFRTFLLHAMTYWAEILHMTLFYCTTDKVPVSSICVNFCGSYATFGTFNTANTQFSALFSYMLLHIELEFFIWLCLLYYRSSLNVVTLCPSIFCTFLLYTIMHLQIKLKFKIWHWFL